MKNIILLAILLISLNVSAEPSVYVSAYNVNIDCSLCEGQPKSYDTSLAMGFNKGYLGVEALLTNDSSIGYSLYLQLKPNDDFRIYTGISGVPNSAIVQVPEYGDIQDSRNIQGLMVGVDYKIFTARYLVYDVDYSITMQEYDPNTKSFINQQTGSVSLSKSSIWLGLTYKF